MKRNDRERKKDEEKMIEKERLRENNRERKKDEDKI